ncbi:phosphomannomutase/phosphoglucomutase [Methyloradius palustris]|uniref:Phosphoglucomutase n=1 Tax=Methyloradius palustris TaxID=2778876 RepID=A0A8D5G121_9PROT|nr:phosphomannomutase/phosphoglucomutase [Methyloradius palustris]BCM25415.1 phosphoglucomutase [Methyloradius palustris]
MIIPKEIFKAYDIRGIVGKTLTPEIVQAIGQAIGSEAIARKQTRICVGYDGRLSGPELAAALSLGIRKTGIDVIQLGCVATPMVYFAAHHLGTDCGVMVTGSHNPPDYNGLKIVLDGETLSEAAIQSLRVRIEQNDLVESSLGAESHYDIAPDYIARIASDIKLTRKMKVAVDCGNGVAGAFARKLYEALGCEVEELFCEVDGHFPNHHPDPSVPENLADLITALKNGDAEIGLAFDGDGDRLGVVTKQGNIIYPDRQLLLFAEDVLKHEPGATIIFDVKCTRNLSSWIKARGGKPVMWKTGHSLVKAKIKETSAALAGEMTGHLFFNDQDAATRKKRWYGFDDGLYAGARLLEILSRSDNPSAILDALPDSISTPEQHIRMLEGETHKLITHLQSSAKFEGAIEVITIDGLRVEYADGFGLMRASNTTPVLVLRFEADDPEALKRIQNAFRAIILAAEPYLNLPF